MKEYLQTAEEVMKQVKSAATGLTSNEAKERLRITDLIN